MNTLVARDAPASRGALAAASARPAQQPAAERPSAAPQAQVDAVRRYVTQGRYGTIVIDVVGEAMYVNGEPVEPAARPVA